MNLLLLTCLLTFNLSQTHVIAQPSQENLPPPEQSAKNTYNSFEDFHKAKFKREDINLFELRSKETAKNLASWASRFGRDVHYGSQEATSLRLIRDQFDPAKSDPARRGAYKASIVSIDWPKMHNDIVKTISNTMSWHKSAVEAIARASEQLAGNHTYDKHLKFEYVDVHKIEDTNDLEGNYPGSELEVDTQNSTDVDGVDSTLSDLPNQDLNELNATDTPALLPVPAKLMNQLESDSQDQLAYDPNSSSQWETQVKLLELSRHPNFDVKINTDESAVHVPVHIYPGEPTVMNGIAWSSELTRVFRDNFARNPKLTNQYFASQSGFLRLFPAQKWQIARTDPDLYDARMRPWYVAGASSRKDVVILVDGSGSMTGSRRDIAKGVVFEILDTLTDNDHFLVLKFSDVVEQIGVPACDSMRVEPIASNIAQKNTLSLGDFPNQKGSPVNGTDISALYLLPATGRNIRQLKTNFTIPTSGIANFSNALITAFEVLRKYQNTDKLGSQCNQAMMLITDGSPSDFEDVFNRYNYPNAPVRVFTYLIGRESNDGSNSKMMACHNRGFYTHVINLAEVRETVQQYIPVMARPLVLNGTHPITWTPAYGELTYQILTDWIWESKRRDKAKAILAASGRGASSNKEKQNYVDIKVTNDDNNALDPGNEDQSYEMSLDDQLDAIDLFGYNTDNECFWETKQNDLLTTVVQPVYDRKNESIITEKFLVKNTWTIKETLMRTAQILGVAAADMKINDIISLAPSYKLGPNGYSILLTNNGFIMHHPNLRSILEPFGSDPSEKNMRILKPFFSSVDFTEVEHILNSDNDDRFKALREESVMGLTGWRELLTKRTLDCQRRVRSRVQNFYYKPIEQFPFSLMVSIPQPYGSHRVEAQVELKSTTLPERLTTYFTRTDYDIWTVHPGYSYCDGPANNTIATLLDMLQRIEARKLDDIQWRPSESTQPQLYLPGKIVCDKDLVQSLVYDAVATFGFSETSTPPNPDAESSLLGMFGVRFSFIATRSGLTRVRYFDPDDKTIKREVLAFAKKHARTIDETFYSRSVDYNLLINESATLIQVPFITYEKIQDKLNLYEANQMLGYDAQSIEDGTTPDQSLDAPLRLKDMNLMEKLEILTNTSLHVIATQSIVVNEGAQRAVAGVAGVFYDYASFVLRFFNSTNTRFQDGKPILRPSTCYTGSSSSESCDESKMQIRCGYSNDTTDCLLIDDNGFIVVSEDLTYIGRHLKAYDLHIMSRLISNGVFHEVNVTDHQSVCLKQEEKAQSSNAISVNGISMNILKGVSATTFNFLSIVVHVKAVLLTLLSNLMLGSKETSATQQHSPMTAKQLQALQPMLSLLPNKTYIRPCEKILTRYETRNGHLNSMPPEFYKDRCNCESWFVYEQVPMTNLIMLVVETSADCKRHCDTESLSAPNDLELDVTPIDATTESQVCSMFEREAELYRKKLDSCFAHHPEEEHIKICGSSMNLLPENLLILSILIYAFRVDVIFVRHDL